MTTQARELAKLVNNSGDVNLGDDITLGSDGALLNFGADSDVVITHVADTGLLLNSSRQLQFGDSGTHIRQSADGVLQLTSDTEVEINATTIDINGNVDISGNLVLGGNITIGDADSDDISFGGELTSHIVPNADDTYDLGSSTKQWRNLYVDGTANLDVVDIDGAVDFASTTAHAGNASFADNAKAIFGAGSDLQIYHDGSNSYINDAGTGNLNLDTNSASINLTFNSGAENMLTAAANGAVVLYHDNNSKLATDAEGANVTGLLDVSSKVVVAGGTEATNSDGSIRTAGGISAAKKIYSGSDVDAVNFKINGAQGSDGQLMTSTGSGVAWEDAPASGPSKGLAIAFSMIF